MELSEEEDTFDVFGYLKKLKKSRKGLIENLVCNFSDNFQSHFIIKAKAFVFKSRKIANKTKCIFKINENFTLILYI